MFGFVADPNLTVSHNLSIAIMNMPAELYFSRPTNLAFHNLCLPSTILPAGVRGLLGLGLNFCPRPAFSNGRKAVQLVRFDRDCLTRMLFCGSPPRESDSGLFVRSDWTPIREEIPAEFRARVSFFVRRMETLFKKRRQAPSSLLLSQSAAFNWLHKNENIVVFPTDKNLGPATIERDRYIRLALDEHLSCKKTYRQLTKTSANNRVAVIRKITNNIADDLDHLKRHSDATFLRRCLEKFDNKEDPFPYFYLTAKVHKTPLKTRPIVSVSGSISHGLGRWVDCCLQRLCRHLPYRTISSSTLCDDLRKIKDLPPTARLFTCDATSMYTNIDINHALTIIQDFIEHSPQLSQELGVPVPLFIAALRCLMIHNVFRFGDTYWLQLFGTAMGTPPAPMYATLYFGILEQKLIPKFLSCLFYNRFIDDGFGIWVPPAGSPSEQLEQWQLFREEFNAAAPTLQWTFSELSHSVVFLDMTVSTTPTGCIHTSIYEKPLNLHLYLPQHSCHPQGILKSLIFGMMLRFFRLSSDAHDAQQAVRRLLYHLQARGYQPHDLNRLMSEAYAKYLRTPKTPSLTPALTTPPETWKASPGIFLHLPYHPLDPTSHEIQRIFTDVMVSPPGEPHLEKLRNFDKAPFDTSRLIIAYSRPSNLGNFFSPRKMRPPGIAPSEVLLSITSEKSDAVDPNP